MPQSMSKTQINRFTHMCEDQGIRVTRTKKGLLLRFPDGSSTVQHFTNSDTRAEQNQIARFRRAGMTHPNDTRRAKETLPAYITSGTISEKTRRRIIDYVASQGYPEAVLSSTIVKDLKMDPGWANRALYHTGFRPGTAKSRKVGRPWYTPEEILCLKDQVTEESEPTPEEEAQVLESLASPIEDFVEVGPPVEQYKNPVPTIEETAEPEWLAENTVEVEPEPEVPVVVEVTQEQAEDIQFIDMRDSWVVDMEELLGQHLHRMVTERLSVLKAVGVEYEMRVWRK
jgi:hypothetical protein